MAVNQFVFPLIVYIQGLSKMALIYLLYIIVVFYWQIKTLKTGKNTKIKAIGLYVTYMIVPIILYGVVFITLVGIEELTNTAIINEEYARSLLFLIVGGIAVTIVTTLVFSIVVFMMKNK